MAGFVWRFLNKKWLSALRSSDAEAVSSLSKEGYPKMGMKESLETWLSSLDSSGLNSDRADRMAYALGEAGIIEGMSSMVIFSLASSERRGARRLLEAFETASPEAVETCSGLMNLFGTDFDAHPRLSKTVRTIAAKISPARLVSMNKWLEYAGKFVPKERIAELLPFMTERDIISFALQRWDENGTSSLKEEGECYGVFESGVLGLAIYREGLNEDTLAWARSMFGRGNPIGGLLLLAPQEDLVSFAERSRELLEEWCVGVRGLDPEKDSVGMDEMFPSLSSGFDSIWRKSHGSDMNMRWGVNLPFVRSLVGSCRMRRKALLRNGERATEGSERRGL